jgi:diketogulonate reductase-like aldo/keto reductase
MADIKTPIPSIKLNDGTSLPMLAYGTGTAWSKRGTTSEEDIDRKLVEGIKSAINMGYRHFDCAESK